MLKENLFYFAASSPASLHKTDGAVTFFKDAPARQATEPLLLRRDARKGPRSRAMGARVPCGREPLRRGWPAPAAPDFAMPRCAAPSGKSSAAGSGICGVSSASSGQPAQSGAAISRLAAQRRSAGRIRPCCRPKCDRRFIRRFACATAVSSLRHARLEKPACNRESPLARSSRQCLACKALPRVWRVYGVSRFRAECRRDIILAKR